MKNLTPEELLTEIKKIQKKLSEVKTLPRISLLSQLTKEEEDPLIFIGVGFLTQTLNLLKIKKVMTFVKFKRNTITNMVNGLENQQSKMH